VRSETGPERDSGAPDDDPPGWTFNATCEFADCVQAPGEGLPEELTDLDLERVGELHESREP
jgi:hypothetical protein